VIIGVNEVAIRRKIPFRKCEAANPELSRPRARVLPTSRWRGRAETKIRRVDVDDRAELLIIPASDAPLAGCRWAGLAARFPLRPRQTFRRFEARKPLYEPLLRGSSLPRYSRQSGNFYFPLPDPPRKPFLSIREIWKSGRVPRVWHEGMRDLLL